MVTALTHDTWESAIRDAWSAVRNRVEVTRDLGIATCARGRSHAILTDIICWTDLEFRVAVEVKAPVRSEEGSNSAMTHGRMAFYKDIDRLRYVVGSTSTKVKRGMFLAVVNELGYVTHRQQRKNLDYNTFHETTVQGGAVLAATEGRNGCPWHDVQALLRRNASTLAWTKRVVNRQVVQQLNLTLDASVAYEMAYFGQQLHTNGVNHMTLA